MSLSFSLHLTQMGESHFVHMTLLYHVENNYLELSAYLLAPSEDLEHQCLQKFQVLFLLF